MFSHVWERFLDSVAAGKLGLLGLALVMLPGPGVQAADTYRWVDEQGMVHYSDRVPPEESKQPRAKLSPSAKAVELYEGAKSKEQLDQAKRLKQLRVEQQQILTEQKARDSSLLRTYHSEEEMQLVLQGKLNTVEATKKITEANRQHQEEILQNLVARAADAELSGQTVPKNLLDSIEAARQQIATYQEKSRQLENSKGEITAAFAKDFERYKKLEALRSDAGLGSQEWRQQEPQADVNILSAVNCQPSLCDKAWGLAKEYLASKLGKTLVTETDNLLQTTVPHQQRDLGILVVRIPGKLEDILFLDTSCHPSSIGDEVCKGSQAGDVRAGFVPYLEKGLKAVGR